MVETDNPMWPRFNDGHKFHTRNHWFFWRKSISVGSPSSANTPKNVSHGDMFRCKIFSYLNVLIMIYQSIKHGDHPFYLKCHYQIVVLSLNSTLSVRFSRCFASLNCSSYCDSDRSCAHTAYHPFYTRLISMSWPTFTY